MRRSALLSLAVLATTGCAPATLQELRSRAEPPDAEFTTNQPYQAVYRTISEMSRKCFQGGLFTGQMVVQSDLYTDIKTGQVSVALHGGFGVDTYLGTDIAALSEQTTGVKVYAGIRTWKFKVPQVQRWVETGDRSCP